MSLFYYLILYIINFVSYLIIDYHVRRGYRVNRISNFHRDKEYAKSPLILFPLIQKIIYR